MEQRFTMGDDIEGNDGDSDTFGINDGEWGNRIEVYGSSELRDVILSLLVCLDTDAGVE